MSQTLTIARPYARAAFSLAHEHGRLAQWSAALGFAALAVSEPSVNSVLGDPRLESQSLVDVLLPPGEVDPLFRQMLAAAKQVVDPQGILNPGVLFDPLNRPVGRTGALAG